MNNVSKLRGMAAMASAMVAPRTETSCQGSMTQSPQSSAWKRFQRIYVQWLFQLPIGTHLAVLDPEIKPFERRDIFHTKYVLPKSLKFSHWPSKGISIELVYIYRSMSLVDF